MIYRKSGHTHTERERDSWSIMPSVFLADGPINFGFACAEVSGRQDEICDLHT